jgi:hypothetical protein
MMVELSNGLEISSMQGANRRKSLIETLDFEPNKFQAEEASKADIREMGASLNPSKLAGLFVLEPINAEASVHTVVPPEIGKGSLTNSIV